MEILVLQLIKKNLKKIKIPFSEEDLQDLLHGKKFDWTFDGVDVHLYKCEEGDEEE